MKTFCLVLFGLFILMAVVAGPGNNAGSTSKPPKPLPTSEETACVNELRFLAKLHRETIGFSDALEFCRDTAISLGVGKIWSKS